MKLADKTARSGKIKEIAVPFDGGKLRSDAGAVLLRQVDPKLRLYKRFFVSSDYPNMPLWCRII